MLVARLRSIHERGLTVGRSRIHTGSLSQQPQNGANPPVTAGQMQWDQAFDGFGTNVTTALEYQVQTLFGSLER